VRWHELVPSRGALLIALFVCVVAPATLTWIEIVENPKFSPIDEAAHFDYVDRVARGELPRQGERLLDSTLREVACRKTAFFEVTSPPCDTPRLRYEQFSSAWQYEAQQPPTYYAITLPLRWTAQNALMIDDELRATRAANIVLLSIGLILLWTAGRLMAIDPLPLGAALLLLAAAPNVIYAAGTVSNDVTAIPAAGLVAVVAAVAHRRGRAGIPLALFAAGFAATMLKTTNLFPVVTVAALFGVAAISRRAAGEASTTTLRRWLRDGGALLAGGLVAAASWAVLHRSLSLIDLTEEPTFDALRTRPRTFDLVIREAVELLRPLGTGAPAETLSHAVQAPLYAALSFLLLGAGLAGLFVSPRRWPHVLGLIAVPLLYLGGVVFGLGLMINYDIDPGLSGRYALSLAPLLILALAASLAGKWSQRTIAAFAAAFFVTMLAAMLS
jgi:hypothetical protein